MYNIMDLVNILRFQFGYKIKEISEKAGIHRKTLERYIKKNNNKCNDKFLYLIRERAEESLEVLINDTNWTLKMFKDIDASDWKDLLLGLQEKLNVPQPDLLKKIGYHKEPNSIISIWIGGKTTPSNGNKFKIIRFVKSRNLDSKQLINYGKKIRKSIKVDGKWIFFNESYERDDFGKNLIIKKQNKLFLNTALLFPDSFNGHKLRFVLNKDKLIIFYYEKRSSRPEPIVLLKYLDINEDFLVGLGIYLAEGSRNRKPKVTNSEPLIIDQAVRFFELIGISKPKLKAWIQLHERSVKSFNEVNKFWLENTLLEKNNIVKLRMKKSVGDAKVKQMGTLHLESTFILSQLFIRNLLLNLTKIVNELSKDQKIWFLRGAFAGEGHVSTAKSGSVNTIQYTTINIKERRLIKRLLQEFGLRVHEDNSAGDLRLMGFFDIEKLMNLDIFKYHPLRKNALLEGFNRLKTNYVRGVTKKKILNFLRKKTLLTTPEITDKFEFTERGIRRHLDDLYNSGKINKIEGKRPRPHRWFVGELNLIK